MRSHRLWALPPFVVVTVLVVLLGVLAVLQYRWIARLSEAERQRLQVGLERAAGGVCNDLDREVARAMASFRVRRPQGEASLGAVLGRRLQLWRNTAPYPELIRGLMVIRRRPTGDAELLRLDEKKQALEACEWTPELTTVRRSFRERPPGPSIDERLPGLVVPIEERRGHGRGPEPWTPPRDHLVIRFDRDCLVGSLLPHLVSSRFGSDAEAGPAFSVEVTVVGQPERLIFSSGPRPDGSAFEPVVTHRLLALKAFPEHGLAPEARDRPRPGAGPLGGIGRPVRSAVPPESGGGGRWKLAVYAPRGSLENEVARARRRNLVLSLATLVLLGATVLLMFASGRRAQRLARQQMDFVASVSHELRTPLTAIRSAGQNLADGIVDDPERVRRYGLMVEREGRRLTEMIGRVLTFAGISSGQQVMRLQPVDVSDLVGSVLADCRWVLQERGIEVELEVTPELPPAMADPGALRQVVANLVDNAIKHGGAGSWLGVRVAIERSSQGAAIVIRISDRGPGIPRKELQEVFEPFHRGGEAAARGVPGSGLGLSVVKRAVEAQNGRVMVRSRPGQGTTFTVVLPAADGQEGGRS